MYNNTNHQPSDQYLEAYIRASSILGIQQLRNYSSCDHPSHPATALQMMMGLHGSELGTPSGLPIRPPPTQYHQALNSISSVLSRMGSTQAQIMPSPIGVTPHTSIHTSLHARRPSATTIPWRIPPWALNTIMAPTNFTYNTNSTHPPSLASIAPELSSRKLLRRHSELILSPNTSMTTTQQKPSICDGAKVVDVPNSAASDNAKDNENAAGKSNVDKTSTSRTYSGTSQQENLANVEKQRSSHSSRRYIDKVHMLDVLCGRGGRSNRHPGNQYFRRLVLKMKDKYRIMQCNDAKKDLSMEVIQKIYDSGGRFIKMDRDTDRGKFYVLTLEEALKKTSQALRESRSPIWT